MNSFKYECTCNEPMNPCMVHCSCGSGHEAKWYKDARGIELFKGCGACAPAKLAHYRPEVLTDPNYLATEEIESD